MGLAIQLKTSVQENEGDRIIFCRSSVRDSDPNFQKHLRINDVENRIYDMYGATGTCQFVLVHVNLLHSVTTMFQLHNGENVVGRWLDAENVCTPPRQTHVWVKTRYMSPLCD